jgi:hypothetical protein
MKKLFVLFALAGGLLVITSQDATGQEASLTSKTATKKMGYTILNPGEAITVYKYVHMSHSPKEAEKYAPKYFFTTGSSDELQALTVLNLKKAFPENHSFHDALDANFKEDKELSNYDSFHKMLKITWLYKNDAKK